MGKGKQTQRTKNNARPSNSSRSAELLGSSVPNFVGFSAVKDGSYVPVLPGLSLSALNDVEISNVDPSFQIALKKMNKKDAITKYKALKEFATLCKESELSAVEGMLPFWPRLYHMLVIDIVHRVREAAQVAHAAVVKRVGKGIAVYLKQLAGPWFTSQFDTYAPAASVATNSFNETFPEQKYINAIVHCQHEILSYISENIINQSPQSLSAQKSLTPEEMVTRYQIVLVSNLQSYSFYFNKVSNVEIEKSHEIHEKLISSNKFWKLAKHEALPVKTGFFNTLTSIIENAYTLLEHEKKKTMTSIMNSIDETDPGLLSAVWESVLVAVNKIEDWYLVISIEKLVLPKLWRVLKSGGQCCARVIYPNLLPFISHFPKLNLDKCNLYTNFFDNMREGFSVKSVMQSRSEMFAITKSFVECLRYSILLNTNDENLCDKLLKEQLLPVIRMCIKENPPMKQIFFCEITQLVRYWSKNRNTGEYPSYSCIIKQFWLELKTLFDIPQPDNLQIEFLLNLKNAPSHNRKNFKVKFVEFQEIENSDNQIEYPEIIIDVDDVFNNELYALVNELCLGCFKQINTQSLYDNIEYLNELITQFGNGELFTILYKCYDLNNSVELYDKILKNWLSNKFDQIEPIVGLIFNLMDHANDTEKDEILQSLVEMEDFSVLKNVMYCCLSKNNRKNPTIRKWCSMNKLNELLIRMIEEIISGDCEDDGKNENVISLAFETTDRGDSLIPDEKIVKITMILCDSINTASESRMIHLVELISKLTPLLWTHNKVGLGAIYMLQTLFKLCTLDDCNDTESMRIIIKDIISTQREKLSETKFLEVIKEFARIIWLRIFETNEDSSKTVLIDLTTDVFQSILISSKEENTSYVKDVITTFLTECNIQTWMIEVTKMVVHGETITGNLYLDNLQQNVRILKNVVLIDLADEISTDYSENCLKWALFNIKLLSHLHSDDTKTKCIEFSGMSEIVMNIVHTVVIGEIYSKHYKSCKNYNSVNTLLISIKNFLKDFQRYLSKEIHEEILSEFQLMYPTYGCLLPYIINFYCKELYSQSNPVEYIEKCKINSALRQIHEKQTQLQEIQILSQYMELDKMSLPTDCDPSALIILRYTLKKYRTVCTYTQILDRIISSNNETTNLLFFDSDVSNAKWEELSLPLETIRLLTELVEKIPNNLITPHWDFILISLASWQMTINKSRHRCQDIKVITFLIAVNQLYQTLENFMRKHEIEKSEDLPPTLLDEWKNVFAGDIHIGISQTWMHYADLYDKNIVVYNSIVPLNYLGQSITIIEDMKLLLQVEPVQIASLKIDLNEIILSSLKLLKSPLPSVQLGAYHMLKKILFKLILEDELSVELENFTPDILNVKKFYTAVTSLESIVNAILMDFKLCNIVSCTIQPYTDSYTYTLGYLLIWAIVLDMCAQVNGDLRYQYAEILKEGIFPNFLNNIFRLMPVEVLQDNKHKSPKLTEIFSTLPSMNFGENWTESKLDHIACWLYTNSLRCLPVLVRQWWNTSDSRVSVAVDKITTLYVSPLLCHEELLDNRLASFDNMQIKIHPTAREVIALYEMDDTKLELGMVLPLNHPLGQVTVEPGQHAGGAANWRNCHMQLSIFLTHQNGSIWDGLMMWKKNLDKKFAGVEECYICFSIFHISTYQIPKLSCHTCRKKFHTSCLYKWFSTSQKSTCPICRNVF